MPTRDPCATHNLWLASHPVRSQDGTKVYLVCTCQARRVVSAQAWQAELTRRQTAQGVPREEE